MLSYRLEECLPCVNVIVPNDSKVQVLIDIMAFPHSSDTETDDIGSASPCKFPHHVMVHLHCPRLRSRPILIKCVQNQWKFTSVAV